jgi:hypothetical protein
MLWAANIPVAEIKCAVGNGGLSGSTLREDALLATWLLCYRNCGALVAPSQQQGFDLAKSLR